MTRDRYEIKRWARWLGTFVGFPLAGVAARAVAGNIDAPVRRPSAGWPAAPCSAPSRPCIGGIERRAGCAGSAPPRRVWPSVSPSVPARSATAPTPPASWPWVPSAAPPSAWPRPLSIPMRRVDRVLWAVATPVLWAGGWLITSQVIVDADRQHAVFGASGALAVSALAGVLYAMRDRAHRPAAVALAGTSSDQAAA